MANNTIEAKLKIAADFAEAIRDLRALRAEIKGANADAAKTGSTPGDAGAKAAATAARQAATERTSAARDAAAAEKKAAKDSADEQKRQLRELEAARRQAAQEQRRQAAAQAAATSAAARTARTEQLRQAQLAPQLTDIVTGLAGGQNPLLVAIQQGGQLRDVFGGAANAGRAFLSIFTPLRVLALGAAAAVGTIATAFFAGREENKELNRTLTATGNIAAQTVGQVNLLAREISAQQQVATSGVRETLGALLATGQFTGATVAVAGRAVTAFARVTGESADETIKRFAEMGNGVAAWAVKTNQQYNFLTVATFERIRALEAEGRTQEAMRLGLESLASTMEQRAIPATGFLERAWKAVGLAVSSTWEALKNIGREETAEEKIARLTQRLEELRKVRDSSANLGSVKTRARADADAVEAELEALRRLTAADGVRRQERATAQQAENDKIARASKSFQDALASVDAAGAQKRLATELAALERKRGETELAHKQGITSELQHNLALNAIEQQRLQAQAANLARQIELERGKVEERPEDGLGKQARVSGLEAQLLELRQRISSTVLEARGIVDSDALSQARDSATEWARVWQQSFNFIRELARQNALDQAAVSGESGDPGKRAEEAAQAKTAALRQQAEELRRALDLRLSLTLDPGQQQALRAQIDELAAQTAAAIQNTGRKAQVQSLRDQLAQLQAEISEREAEIDQRLARGAITSAEAEREGLQVRAQAIPQLEAILKLMEAIAATSGDLAAVSRLRKELEGLKDTTTEFEKTMRGGVASSFSTTFQEFVTGTKTAGQAFRDFIAGVARTALDFIARRLGEELASSLIPSGSGGGGGDWISAITTFIGSFFHGGGIIGSNMAGMTRAVSPMLWATAQRYHSGGLMGLGPDEVPIIGRKGEEVLTESDPRHRKNGGGGAGIQVNLSVNVGGGANGGNDQATGQALGRMLENKVVEVITDQMRPGGLLAGR